jgi:hypothetical protein
MVVMLTSKSAEVHVVGSADFGPLVAGASVAPVEGASVAAAGGSVAAAGGFVAGAAAPPQADNTKLARTSRLIKANSLRIFFSSQKN